MNSVTNSPSPLDGARLILPRRRCCAAAAGSGRHGRQCHGRAACPSRQQGRSIHGPPSMDLEAHSLLDRSASCRSLWSRTLTPRPRRYTPLPHRSCRRRHLTCAVARPRTGSYSSSRRPADPRPCDVAPAVVPEPVLRPPPRPRRSGQAPRPRPLSLMSAILHPP